MNKNIKIEHYCLVDYNILLEVIAQYVKQHQISRSKLLYEKDMFDLTDTLYSLECFKHPQVISVGNHRKDFWVIVKESKTQYTFKIWYK